MDMHRPAFFVIPLGVPHHGGEEEHCPK
jgi:hypothetical protein